MNDPIVEEVRRYRNEHAKRFNYDVKAIAEDYKQKHESNVLLLKEIKNNFNNISSFNHFFEEQKKGK